MQKLKMSWKNYLSRSLTAVQCHCFLWTQWTHVKNALVWAASSMWQLCHNSPEPACTLCKGHVMQNCQFVQFLFHVQIVITYQPNAVHSAMTPVILSLILILCSPRRVDSTTASKLFQKTSVTEFSSVSSSSTPASEVRTIQRMSLMLNISIAPAILF